jgi:hypothetical protein
MESVQLPSLSAFLKAERETMKQKLAQFKAKAKLYLKLLRTLQRHGVQVNASSYDADNGEITIQLFEKHENGRIKFAFEHGWYGNGLGGPRLRPELKRTSQGTPVVAILGKIAGFRLSKAEYRWPSKTETADVYRCTGIVELSGKWTGLRVEFSALFHDKEGQRCRIEKTMHERERHETLAVTCNVA